MVRKIIKNNDSIKFEPKWGKKSFSEKINQSQMDSEQDGNIGLVSDKFITQMVNRLKLQGIEDRVVLQAMLKTPRHFFVDSALSSRAYEDTALPIGYKQTISQPYVVARVTALVRRLTGLVSNLDSQKGKVLEIGTGCGYQAAVMSKCFSNVFSVERISGLYEESKKRLSLMDKNIEVRFGDGLKGWPDQSPFDAIIFSGSLEKIPIDLLSQIRINGVMIMPIGKTSQKLVAVVRKGENNREFTKHVFDYVRYVPILDGVEK